MEEPLLFSGPLIAPAPELHSNYCATDYRSLSRRDLSSENVFAYSNPCTFHRLGFDMLSILSQTLLILHSLSYVRLGIAFHNHYLAALAAFKG